MNDESTSSSLPILLTISAAILVTVGGGWFLLDEDFSWAPAEEVEAALEPELKENITIEDVDIGASDGGAKIETLALAHIPAELEVLDLPPEESAAPLSLKQDANLRKARMAAEAEMLLYPVDQSALFYYSQILDVDAEHAIAKAELDAVLSRIAQAASAHMNAEQYSAAYDIAVLVSRKNPGHPLVQEVTQELDRLTNTYVEEGIQFAQDGDDEAVETALSAAEALPGRNPEYFAAVRDSIANIRNSRITAEQGKLERVRLAAVQETTAWVEKVRDAIEAGRLIAPDEENAIDYLAERESPEVEKAVLVSELVSALVSACSTNIDNGDLKEAELLLNAATDYIGDTDQIQELQAELHQANIEAEASKVMSLDDFVRINTTPAAYPRRAQERDIQGWVDVLFTVTTSGETADIEVQEAEPLEVFEKAAVDAVEGWTFEPRVFRGEAISQRASARLVFRFE